MPLSAPELNKQASSGRGFSMPHRQASQGNGLRYLLLASLVVLLLLGFSKMLLQSNRVPESIQVVAAGQDIPSGCKISFNSLHYLSIPRRYATSSMFSSYEQLVGKITRGSIAKASPILKSDILASSTFSQMLAGGTRAITLRLDPELQVDHAIEPGDRVDVLVTCACHSSKGGNQKFTKTICQNLIVLLCTTREELLLSRTSPSSQSNRVTLSASPADCERLSQAADTGKLRLVLRNPANLQEDQLSGADERDLIPAYALKEIALAESAPATVASSSRQTLLPPPPPVFPNDEANSSHKSAGIADSLHWVVEMFSGARRESYAVPLK